MISTKERSFPEKNGRLDKKEAHTQANMMKAFLEKARPTNEDYEKASTAIDELETCANSDIDDNEFVLQTTLIMQRGGQIFLYLALTIGSFFDTKTMADVGEWQKKNREPFKNRVELIKRIKDAGKKLEGLRQAGEEIATENE